MFEFLKSKKQYDEIVLLVHPLHNLIYSLVDSESLEEPLANEKEALEHISQNKRLKNQLKKSLAAYGQKILECKDKPNILFVLVNILPSNPAKYRNEKIYSQLLKKIYALGKSNLGQRFIVTNSNPEFTVFDYRAKERIFKSSINKIKPKVKIYSFGEYADKGLCVENWTQYAVQELNKKGIEVIGSKIITDSSLFRNLDNLAQEIPTLNDRLKIGHDRRKERNKIKKRKLNYKHKIK